MMEDKCNTGETIVIDPRLHGDDNTEPVGTPTGQDDINEEDSQ